MKWKCLGVLTVLVPVIIMTYYAVIGDWIKNTPPYTLPVRPLASWRNPPAKIKGKGPASADAGPFCRKNRSAEETNESGDGAGQLTVRITAAP